MVDVLYHGLASGATGPVRPGATTDWEGQPIGLPWSQNFPNGLNYAFADGDGNGVVDDEDLDEAIRENFGEQHGVVTPDGFANAAPGSGPTLRLQPTSGVVETDGLITIDLFLEGNGAPLTDFYGIALQMSYRTTGGSETGDLDFAVADMPWYDPTVATTNSLEFYFSDDDAQTASLALVRKDQQTVSGEGLLGRFSVVIEDIIAIEAVDTFILSIDSVLVVGEGLMPQAVVVDQTLVIVADDPSSVTATAEPRPEEWKPLLIYPNPVRSRCRVVTALTVEAWQLVDLTGRTYAPSTAIPNGTDYELTLPSGLPAGVYFLRAITTKGILQQRILLHK